jgi:DNA-directed RNA polymerase subunit RPC12/RpoP
MNKDIATFEAKCAECGKAFEHPSLGDFAYGENIFYTNDGMHQVWVSAFSAFPQRVKKLIDGPQPMKFWDILASCADPVNGQKFVAKIICPHCNSDGLESWEGRRIGMTSIQEATFLRVLDLEDSTLALRIEGDASP